jgi:hypothetical protein
VRVGTTALFLYNTSTNQLHGVFEASAPPAMNIDPDAFHTVATLAKNKVRWNHKPKTQNPKP